jgi:hypothetical protein
VPGTGLPPEALATGLQAEERIASAVAISPGVVEGTAMPSEVDRGDTADRMLARAEAAALRAWDREAEALVVAAEADAGDK